MGTQTWTGTIEVIDCASCGMAFGITPRFQKDRRKDHKTFYCPAGCSNFYSQKSEAEKLRDRLAREQHLREQTYAELRDLRSAQTQGLALATEQAKRFRHSRPALGAFWKGYEHRGCSALPTDCPYETNRGGFRSAWFAGAGIEESDE